jgi:hypothetical protein
MPVIQDEKNKIRLEKEKRLTFTLMLYVGKYIIKKNKIKMRMRIKQSKKNYKLI